MSELLRDIRYGLRLLRRSPGFTAVALSALALGIAANSAIFSVVNSVLLRPLPYPESSRVGIIFEASPAQGWQQIGISGPDYAEFREQAKSLDDVALIERGTGTVLGFGEPIQAPGLRVTNNLFRLLGKKPMLGRDFTPEEGFENRVGILSYSGWHKLFGNDASVIGRRVIVDDIPYTIIGVMPPDFWLPLPADVFAPWSTEDLRRRSTMDHSFVMLGRVKHGRVLPRGFGRAGHYRAPSGACGAAHEGLGRQHHAAAIGARGECAARAAGVARGGRSGVADRMHESGESDAGQSRFPWTRDGDSYGPGSHAARADAPVLRGNDAAWRDPAAPSVSC